MSRNVQVLVVGVLSLGAGAVVSAAVMLCLFALRADTKMEFNSDVVNFYLMLIAGHAIWGALLLVELMLLVVLPVLYFRGAFLPARWMWIVAAVFGGLLAFLPSGFSLYDQLLAGGHVISRKSDVWIWAWPLFFVMHGVVFGGLFGAGLSYFESRGIKRWIPGMESDTLTAPDRTRKFTKGGWVICGLAVTTVCLHIWFSSNEVRKIAAATHVILNNQDGILSDAQQLLDEAESSEYGSVSFSAGTASPSPKYFAMMDDVFISASTKSYQGAVTVRTGESRGLYIVPAPTSATLPMLRSYGVDAGYGYLKVVNEHVYQFYRGWY